jgi:hypothetical protein
MSASGKWKRPFSIAVIALFVCSALFSCARMPKTIFTIGANDSPIGIGALLYTEFLYLPALILALWHRKVAGYILLSTGPVMVIGLIAQRSYPHEVRGFPPDPLSLLFEEILIGLVPAFAGLFLFLTDFYGWPSLLKRRGFDSGS